MRPTTGYGSRLIWGIVPILMVLSGCASMESEYKIAQKTDTVPAYKDFLQRYPQGELSRAAERRIIDLESKKFEDVRQKDTVSAYESFIRDAYSRELIKQAQQRVLQIEQSQARKWSVIWKDSRDSETMAELLSYCWKHQITQDEVQELMGEPAVIHEGRPSEEVAKLLQNSSIAKESSLTWREFVTSSKQASALSGDSDMEEIFSQMGLSEENTVKEILTTIYDTAVRWEYTVKASQEESGSQITSACLDFNPAHRIVAVTVKNSSGGYQEKRLTLDGVHQAWGSGK